MSTCYLGKLMEDKIIALTGSEMVDLLPVNLDWQGEFLLNQPNNATSYKEFYQMVEKFVKGNGQDKALENLYDCSFFSSSEYGRLSKLLHGDLAGELKSRDCFSLEYYYFGNNFLSELLPEYFKPAPLRQLSIDVINVHPDVSFPQDSKSLNKDFCIRLLADLDGTSDSKLYKWFDALNPGSFFETDFGGEGECVYSIIAGAKRTETITIEAESPEFWDKYSDRWWAQSMKDEIMNNSDFIQYQVVNYLIHIHPSWLNKELSKSPFDSTAYAVSY